MMEVFRMKAAVYYGKENVRIEEIAEHALNVVINHAKVR